MTRFTTAAPPVAGVPGAPGQKGWWERNWIWVVLVGCVGVPLFTVGLVVGILAIVSAALRASQPYQDALKAARADVRVAEMIGTPIEPSGRPSGSIRIVNSNGRADVTIPLKGPKGEGRVHVAGVKSAGVWSYSVMEFEGPGGRVELGNRP